MGTGSTALDDSSNLIGVVANRVGGGNTSLVNGNNNISNNNNNNNI